MSNKFYKPKNEYGELLTTQNALNSETKARKEQDEIIEKRLTLEAALIRSEFASADSALKNELELKIDNADNKIKDSIEALDNKLDEVDNKLDTKIDTFRTISVVFVENNSLEDYFRTVIQDKKMTFDELKVELGRSIYIIRGKDDENTWEEYICKNPDFLSESNTPEMIRLGAVDSIFARLEDTDFCMGSVSLAHNLYIKSEEDYKWNKYFDRMMDGEHLDAPIPGKAVAPCALRAFVKADEKLEADNKAVELKLVNITDNLQSQITEIKNELTGNSEATDYEGSRIDKIEEAIGILGCPSCGKDNCEHDSAKGKCTIYCRLNDIEGDIVELDNNINDVSTNLSIVETNLQEEIERATEAEKTLQANIDAEQTRATKAEGVLQTNLDAENLRAVAAETALNEKVDAETTRAVNAEAELQSDINAEESRATEAETYLQGEIDKINEEIGTHDSSSTKTIWQTIDDNFVENKKYTDDKFEVATEGIEKNAKDISGLTSLVSVKGSTNTDTVWGAIGESNSKILNLENSLGEKAVNETKKAWAYIYDHENRLITAEDTIEANTNQISDIITNKIGSSSKGSTDTVWKAIETSEANISNLAEIKADKTTVEAITAEITAEIGKPGNHRDDNTLWGEINGTKDDIIRIDNVIGTTEDASDGNTLHSKIKFLGDTKADTTYVNAQISDVVNTKADKSYVDGELSKKANIVDVDSKLAQKADITYVDGQISTVNATVDTKASLNYINEQISDVNDQITAVNTVIGENKTDEATIWSAISNLKSKANTADATIAEHGSQIALNASEIRDIKSKIGESNTSINRTVWQAIEANAGEISQNAANIAKVKIDADKVDDLSENLDKLTTDFNSLKANVGTSEDSIENGKTLWSATNKNTAEIANNAKNIAKNIEDINNNKLDIVGHTTSIGEINSQIQQLTTSIEGIDTKVDTNNRGIADIKSAIGTSEDGIENGKTVWSKVNANTHAINALTPRITSLETKTSNMASRDYVDSTVADAISDSVEDINNTIAESMAQTKVEVKDYANSLRVGQPGVAVINCVLTSPTVNADGTYGGTKRVHVIDILKGLDSSLFNNLADVNVAVTSTRYIANDDTPGEQITPDIRYYAGTSDDGTNARYFEVTFEDLKVEPKYLIMTITYWEQNKIILV